MFLIVVNKDMPFVRRRFTAAHELKHFFFDRGVIFTETGEEQEAHYLANVFAAELLIPRTFLYRYLPEQPTVKELADIFQVSQQAMKIKVAKLQLPF